MIGRLINKAETLGFTGVVASYFDAGNKLGLSAAIGNNRKTVWCPVTIGVDAEDVLISMLSKSFD